MKYIFPNFTVEVERNCQTSLTLNILLKKFDKYTEVSYLAAQPPNLLQSYTGSALPFPDAEIAYQNTINKGSFKPNSANLSISMKFPNAYYSHLGSRLINPHVILTVSHNNKVDREIIELGEIAPFRLLSYQSNPVPRISPLFYHRETKQKTPSQEELLRKSGYKLKTPNNFWGDRIPNP
tara:strand:+ start:19798 stop:20337 length:540 start_codon:yes stop_codon:yes gene_type:complete